MEQKHDCLGGRLDQTGREHRGSRQHVALRANVALGRFTLPARCSIVKICENAEFMLGVEAKGATRYLTNNLARPLNRFLKAFWWTRQYLLIPSLYEAD